MTIHSINPATAQLVASYQEYSADRITNIINDAQKAFNLWKNTTFDERATLFKKTALILREDNNKFGNLITREMGKPVTQSLAEIEKCAWLCDYLAENAEKLLKREVKPTEASESYVQFDPLGIIFAVMPWNFPFWQVFRFAVPSLMAGNVGLLKHSSNVPQVSVCIEEIFTRAGFPQGVFTNILTESSNVSRIISHPYIKAVTLTGSEAAGQQVAQTSGRFLKKNVLELGGSDSFIILEDADLTRTTKAAVDGRLLNNGQSCIAAKRFIVMENIYDEFKDGFVKLMRSVKIGPPEKPDVELGPLAREDLVVGLEKQVQKCIEKGADLLCGGHRLSGQGFYFEPTVLTNIKKGMPAYDEELFGPVAALFKVKDVEEAIHLANDTCFGLGTSIWTKNELNAKKMADRIEAGMVFINSIVKSDPRLPFGGVKCSGYGRELSEYGIKEFVNIKTVWID